MCNQSACITMIISVIISANIINCNITRVHSMLPSLLCISCHQVLKSFSNILGVYNFSTWLSVTNVFKIFFLFFPIFLLYPCVSPWINPNIIKPTIPVSKLITIIINQSKEPSMSWKIISSVSTKSLSIKLLKRQSCSEKPPGALRSVTFRKA